jgi:hypothetical protein
MERGPSKKTKKEITTKPKKTQPRRNKKGQKNVEHGFVI